MLTRARRWWSGGRAAWLADTSESPSSGRGFDAAKLNAGFPRGACHAAVTARAAHSRAVSAALRGPRQTLAVGSELARRARSAPHTAGHRLGDRDQVRSSGMPSSPVTRAPAAPHRSSIDPPGGISLGAHRKARTGRCQHARHGRGYRSQQEPAMVPGLRGRIGMRAHASPGQPGGSTGRART